LRTINVAAFKAGWRQACAERGIDPEAGPTTFQVLGYKADVESAKKRAAANERRWATAEGLARLKNWGLDPAGEADEETAAFLTSWGAYRSSTEKEALAHVRAEARRVLQPPEPSAEHDVTFIAEDNWAALVLHEVLNELKADAGQEVPLRAIHARNSMKLEWIDLHDGRPLAISVLVPAKAEQVDYQG